MPAAAVIPAPIAYIKVAAVKKLVVGSRVFRLGGSACAGTARTAQQADRLRSLCRARVLNRVLAWVGAFTLNKLECSRQVTLLG